MEQPKFESKFLFSKYSEYPNGNEYSEVVFKQERLDEVLEYFEEFLRRCGYIFDGKLEFVSMKDKCTTREDVLQCACPGEDTNTESETEVMRKFVNVFLEEFAKNINAN